MSTAKLLHSYLQLWIPLVFICSQNSHQNIGWSNSEMIVNAMQNWMKIYHSRLWFMMLICVKAVWWHDGIVGFLTESKTMIQYTSTKKQYKTVLLNNQLIDFRFFISKSKDMHQLKCVNHFLIANTTTDEDVLRLVYNNIYLNHIFWHTLLFFLRYIWNKIIITDRLIKQPSLTFLNIIFFCLFRGME